MQEVRIEIVWAGMQICFFCSVRQVGDQGQYWNEIWNSWEDSSILEGLSGEGSGVGGLSVGLEGLGEVVDAWGVVEGGLARWGWLLGDFCSDRGTVGVESWVGRW
jgi:hypothetical protein